MSEAPDQPVVAAAPVAEVAPGVAPGVAAETPATTTTDDDIDTEAFDRMEAPGEDDAGAGDGQTSDAPHAGQAAAPAEVAETIELEVNGQKVKLPKAIEPLLLMQSDYTKKTQDVAEQARALATEREALETARVQQAESLKANRAEHAAIAAHEASIAAIDADLAKYRMMTASDWTALRASNPADYTAHTDNYDFLKRTRDASADALKAAQDGLSAKETAFTEAQQAASATALKTAWNDTNAVLSKKIEGWSPARGQELADMAVKDLGATAEELQATTDPRIWIAFDEISRLRAENARLKTTNTQATATEAALKSQAVTPAAKPAGGAPKPTGVKDELGTAEWMRRRDEQDARARKAG